MLRFARLLALAAVGPLAVGCADPGEPQPPLADGAEESAGPGRVDARSIVDTPTGPVIAHELVVAAAPGVSPGELADAAAAAGAQVVWRGPRTGRYLLRVQGDTAAAVAELAALGVAAEVGPHRVVSGAGIATTPSPQLQWNLPAAGLDREGGDGRGVLVAVLDTGVAFEDHSDASGRYALAPDLAGVDFAAGYDFVYDDAHPNDDSGHGTHVAAVIAGQGALSPVAGGVDILPVKVLGADGLGSELALAEGILFAADRGAQVINLSLSLSPRAFPSRFLQDAVETASARGAILVAAVGNHGADAVTYPAAFRDVIAVAASSLGGDFRVSHGRDPWRHAQRSLVLAPYSNRGARVDFAAPGGVIDVDRSGDGEPEAILAQSFVADPTELEYVYYAGTSQAAAMASGLAALFLSVDPGLDARELRALLGDTSQQRGGAILSDAGRGFVDYERALRRMFWRHLGGHHYFAGVGLRLVATPGGPVARATVEVLDGDGEPLRHVEVHGSFTGGAFGAVSGRTDRRGLVSFAAAVPSSGPLVVGFRVDAVATRAGGGHVERPHGFVRIDSCSLELLSDLSAAVADGQTTSRGIATTPGPVAIAPPADGGDIAAALLLNYAWSSATLPLAIAVDPAWLAQTFEGAVTVAASGAGVASRPIAIDPASLPLELSVSDAPMCLDLVVRTGLELQGIATTPAPLPVIPDPDGNCREDRRCDDYLATLGALWRGEATGSAVPAGMRAHLSAVLDAYAAASELPSSAPAADYGELLRAAGLGLTPFSGDEPAAGAGRSALDD